MQIKLLQQGQDDYMCQHQAFYWLGKVYRQNPMSVEKKEHKEKS